MFQLCSVQLVSADVPTQVEQYHIYDSDWTKRNMRILKIRLLGVGLIAMIGLVMASCGQASLTALAPASGDPGDISVGFQGDDGSTAGRLFVRTGNSNPDGYVPFFVEMPYMAQGYRLNSILLEFVSEAIQPSILLEPEGTLFGRGIEFTRSGTTVKVRIPDTGRHGDGTVLIRFLAENNTFGQDGLRLNTRLKFGKGIGEASLTIKPVS